MSRKHIFATLVCAALFADSTTVTAEQRPVPPGPVIMVHFDYYPKDRAQVHALEHRLESVIKRANAGELGESELHVDGNDGYLYMYGPDPDRLYAVTSSIMKSSKLLKNAEVTKHYGSRDETFVIGRDRGR